jgi:hypothetical protein
MVCDKCGYKDSTEVKNHKFSFCRVCSVFAPQDLRKIKEYVNDKISWKSLEGFRRYNSYPGSKNKKGMEIKAKSGMMIARPPRGYDLINKKLQLNKDSLKVSKLFSDYLKTKKSFNQFAKEKSVSFNSLKKILTNRTYIGDVKFNSRLYKSNHKKIISPEIFYAVERKLKQKSLLK